MNTIYMLAEPEAGDSMLPPNVTLPAEKCWEYMVYAVLVLLLMPADSVVVVQPLRNAGRVVSRASRATYTVPGWSIVNVRLVAVVVPASPIAVWIIGRFCRSGDSTLTI